MIVLMLIIPDSNHDENSAPRLPRGPLEGAEGGRGPRVGPGRSRGPEAAANDTNS